MVAAVVVMVLGPALVLFTYMHIYDALIGAPWRAGWLTVVAMALAIITGLVAVALFGWSPRTRIWIAGLYAAIAIPVVPFLAFFAQCSTGDCIQCPLPTQPSRPGIASA